MATLGVRSDSLETDADIRRYVVGVTSAVLLAEIGKEQRLEAA
jgi:hypothetical protein